MNRLNIYNILLSIMNDYQSIDNPMDNLYISHKYKFNDYIDYLLLMGYNISTDYISWLSHEIDSNRFTVLP